MVNWLCKIITSLLNDTHKNSLNVIIGFYFFYGSFKTLYFMKVTIFFWLTRRLQMRMGLLSLGDFLQEIFY